MQKVIVICGPTASGKTDLSIELAKKIDGQIISADSMQIYKEMDIGTAKIKEDEMQGIKHYLIDTVEPTKRYSVSEYKKDAKKAIKEIINNGKTPIIVGGTGLYINSLVYDIEYPEIETDVEYRNKLEELVKITGLKELYDKACNIDSTAMKKISPNDKKRILRVLEIYHQTGMTKTELEIKSRQNPKEYDYKVFAINMPREILYERINTRVDKMIANGLEGEVRNLYNKYNKKLPTSLQAIGYKEIIEYIEGKCTLNEAIEKVKQESRRYAKRQITWFKKIEGIIWIDGLNDVKENVNDILNRVGLL